MKSEKQQRPRATTKNQQPLEAATAVQVVDIRIQEAQSGERVDKLLAAELEELSRSAGQRLIKEGLVTLNGVPVKASHRLTAGDLVRVQLALPQSAEIQPEPIPLTILYEDNSLIVIDKPAGMVTHPAHGHTSGTLVNALLAHYPPLAQVDDPTRAGIIHRLDRDTSGVIVVAKTEVTRLVLQAQFKARKVHKTYLALVEGHPEPAEGVIKAATGRDPRNRKRMAVVRGGREAITTYRVLEFFDQQSLVQAEPKTGRTHQIRVHMAFIRHPVVGDRVYGYRKQRLLPERHFLHAHRIRFRHPETDQELEFCAELPDELIDILLRLRAQIPGARPGNWSEN